MGDFIRIIKINFLALLALPILFLSTTVKLFAKLLAKIVWLTGIAVLAIGVKTIFETIRKLDKVTNIFLLGAIFIGMIAVLVAVFFLIRLAVSIIAASFSKVVTTSLDYCYRFLYGIVYAKLFILCQSDHEELLDSASPVAAILGCLPYMLLLLIHNGLIFFFKHAVAIMTLAGMGIVFGGIGMLNYISERDYGLMFLDFVALFPLFEIVYGVVLYLVITVGTAVVLFMIGLEWNEWGMEMQGVTSKKKDAGKEKSAA